MKNNNYDGEELILHLQGCALSAYREEHNGDILNNEKLERIRKEINKTIIDKYNKTKSNSFYLTGDEIANAFERSQVMYQLVKEIRRSYNVKEEDPNTYIKMKDFEERRNFLLVEEKPCIEKDFYNLEDIKNILIEYYKNQNINLKDLSLKTIKEILNGETKELYISNKFIVLNKSQLDKILEYNKLNILNKKDKIKHTGKELKEHIIKLYIEAYTTYYRCSYPNEEEIKDVEEIVDEEIIKSYKENNNINFYINIEELLKRLAEKKYIVRYKRSLFLNDKKLKENKDLSLINMKDYEEDNGLLIKDRKEIKEESSIIYTLKDIESIINNYYIGKGINIDKIGEFQVRKLLEKGYTNIYYKLDKLDIEEMIKNQKEVEVYPGKIYTLDEIWKVLNSYYKEKNIYKINHINRDDIRNIQEDRNDKFSFTISTYDLDYLIKLNEERIDEYLNKQENKEYNDPKVNIKK